MDSFPVIVALLDEKSLAFLAPLCRYNKYVIIPCQRPDDLVSMSNERDARVVILASRVPGRKFLDLIREIRQSTNAGVIVLSDVRDDFTPDEVHAAGAAGYVPVSGPAHLFLKALNRVRTNDQEVVKDPLYIDRYQLEHAIAKSRNSWVYRAVDPRDGSRVAIKILAPGAITDQARERFEQEAGLLRSLNHPGIVKFLDSGWDGDMYFLVCEYVHGETLRRYCKNPALSLHEKLRRCIDIAEALAAAHTHGKEGIIHRDLKPENIMVTPDGKIRIVDFGLAKSAAPIGESEETRFMTDAGLAIGTPGYMSPEQARGEMVGVTTDIFSFGIVAYEMISGRNPFDRGDNSVTRQAILDEGFPPLRELVSELSAAVDECVSRCLKKDRRSRYQNARELADALKAALAT